MDLISAVPLTGALIEGCFPLLLRSLYVGRMTGMLHVTHESHRGSVVFIRGHIVHGETNLPECRMGDTMVRHGLLQQADLERVRSRVTSEKRLGQILLDQGIIDQERLQDALALHAREVLLCIFSWREGSYQFEDHDAEDFKGYDQALRLSTGEVILDAVWSVTDPDVLRYALGDIHRPLILSSDPLLRFQKITLTPTDGYILSRVDGVLTAQGILDIAPVGPEEALRSLLGLLCTGMIEYLPAPTQKPEPELSPARLRERVIDIHRELDARDHFEVLGISRTASPDEVKAAYLRLSRLFHPDAHHEPALADLRDKLNDVFNRLSEANKVLSDLAARSGYETKLRDAEEKPPSPPPPPPETKKPEVEEPNANVHLEAAIKTAEAAADAGRHWDAIAALVAGMPGARGRTLTSARQLLARCYLKVPDRGKEAEQELLAITREDPGNAEAYVLLGKIYRERQLHARAAGMFRKALELKPRHTEARAALDALEPPAPTPKGGFLKKILR